MGIIFLGRRFDCQWKSVSKLKMQGQSEAKKWYHNTVTLFTRS